MVEQHQPDYTEGRTRHLDMIQGVVSRLAGNSAVMKRYCIVMVAVGVPIFKTLGDPWVVVVLIVMVGVFWLLDAKYLQHEKWFRNLYDQVRAEEPRQRPDYRMTPDQTLKDEVSIWGRIMSWSTAGLYLPLSVLIALFLLIWWML